MISAQSHNTHALTEARNIDPPSNPHPASNAQIIPLRPPNRGHDPLHLIQTQAPSESWPHRPVGCLPLGSVLLIWAAFGQLDIIVAAEVSSNCKCAASKQNWQSSPWRQ